MGTKALNPYRKGLILKFVFLHGRHLYRYPSKHSSCANHALAEALGLFIAGLAFPSLRDSDQWKNFGKKVLEKEALRQVYPDGSSFEHSVTYLQFVADHLLVYYLLGKEYGERVSESIEQRLRAVCNFLSSILDAKGNIPSIGDSDDGFLIKLWFGRHNNYFSLLNTCAILFDEPNWIHPAADLDLKTSLLLGSSARSKWQALKAQQSWNRKPRYFNEAGLAIIPDSKFGQEILFVGNSGPLGLEPLAGHGHADALSFWLSVNGQPILVDPGTYLYHSGGKWRRFFRSTRAHNTIEIDEKDQAEQVADFIFGHFYRIRNVFLSDENDRIVWRAEHNGYLRLPDPVLHLREITYLKQDQSFRIVDILKCRGTHNVRLLFHLYPNVKILSEENNIYLLSAKNASLAIRVDKKLRGRVLSGSKDPLMGWYSPSFNRLERTNSIIFETEIHGDSAFESEVRIL
jgi:hypothetical protein